MTQQLTDRLYINPKPNALRSKGMPQNMKILIRYTNVFQKSFVPVLISPRFGIIQRASQEVAVRIDISFDFSNLRQHKSRNRNITDRLCTLRLIDYYNSFRTNSVRIFNPLERFPYMNYLIYKVNILPFQSAYLAYSQTRIKTQQNAKYLTVITQSILTDLCHFNACKNLNFLMFRFWQRYIFSRVI